MIIDNLRRYVDEAAAIADLPAWRIGDQWIGPVIPAVRVYLAKATYDEDGDVVTPAVLAEGWYILVSTATLDPTLITGDAAMLATDRDAAQRGEPFGLFCWDLPAAALVAGIEPLPAGAGYPFGNLVMVA